MESKLINESSELSLIGMILTDPLKVLTEVDQAGIDDTWFRSPVAVRIWTAIVAIRKKNRVPDLAFVMSMLEEQGALSSVGGQAGVCRLVDKASATFLADQHIDTLRRCRLRRQGIGAVAGVEHDLPEADEPEVLIESTVEELRRLLIEGHPSVTTEQVVQQVMACAEEGNPGNIWLPLPWALEGTVGLIKCRLSTIAGRTGQGKTTMALNLLRFLARRNPPTPCGFISLEMEAGEVMEKLIAAEARTNTTAIMAGYGKEDDKIRMAKGAERIKAMPIFLDDTARSIDQICGRIVMMKQRHGVEFVVVDYLQIIRGIQKSNQTRTDVIAQWTGALMTLAKTAKVHICALSQLTRTAEGVRPSLKDLRDSGSIEQDCAQVMFVYRDPALPHDYPESQPSYFEVAKDRRGATGSRILLTFVKTQSRFEEAASGEGEPQE